VSLLSLSDGEQYQYVTDLDGKYAFDVVEEGLDYQVSMEKEGRIDDGITTLDLLLIQRHILGLNPLGSPYRLIAADVDNSQSISARDLVVLRRIILGMDNSFPDGQQSWRFIRADHQFANPLDPFPFPEVMGINHLQGGLPSIDFKGIKIGDVNGTNEVSSRLTSSTRSDALARRFMLENITYEQNELISIPVYLSGQTSSLGFQFALSYESGRLEVMRIEPGAIELSETHFSVDSDSDMLKVSWHSPAGPVDVSASEPLFVIIARTKQEGSLDGVFSVRDLEMKSEWIDESLSAGSIELEFTEKIDFRAPVGIEILASPNPFHASTVLSFNVTEISDGVLTLYDVSGRRLYEVKRSFDPGIQSWSIKKEDLGGYSGTVFVRLKLNQEIYMTKVSLLK
jgi:hypothetical protein